MKKIIAAYLAHWLEVMFSYDEYDKILLSSVRFSKLKLKIMKVVLN